MKPPQLGLFGAPTPDKPKGRKRATPSEAMYRQAYERGITAAAPGMTFAIVGQKVGATLGTCVRAHAIVDGKPLTGDAIIAWIEDMAREFRSATADEPQYHGGWQPFNFAKWLNVRNAKPAKPKDDGKRLQPLAPRRSNAGTSSLQPVGNWKPKGSSQ